MVDPQGIFLYVGNIISNFIRCPSVPKIQDYLLWDYFGFLAYILNVKIYYLYPTIHLHTT